MLKESAKLKIPSAVKPIILVSACVTTNTKSSVPDGGVVKSSGLTTVNPSLVIDGG